MFEGSTQLVKHAGGRPRGSLNRRTRDAQALAEEMRVNPLSYLLSVVKNRRLAPDLRVKAATEACRYLFPRLSTREVSKTVEVSVDLRQQIEHIMLNPELAAAAQRLCLGLMETGAHPEGQIIDMPALEPARLPVQEE